jgi:hypothetical protein
MSRRKTRRDEHEMLRETAARINTHDGLERLSIATTRANLLWLAGHQRDVAAREVPRGSAFTGMPVHRSTEPRLPGVLNGPDLSGDIARALNTLVREVMDADLQWVPDEHETKRWKQAADVVEKVCGDPHAALEWWDLASSLRARAERMLGPAAAGRFLGWCSVPLCPGEIRLGDDQNAAVCPECQGFVTREQQTDYVVIELEKTLMTPSQICTALVQLRAEVSYDTVKSWARRGKIHPPDWDAWAGVPYVVPCPKREDGLYSFLAAFHLAAGRATMVRLEGKAA